MAAMADTEAKDPKVDTASGEQLISDLCIRSELAAVTTLSLDSDIMFQKLLKIKHLFFHITRSKILSLVFVSFFLYLLDRRHI